MNRSIRWLLIAVGCVLAVPVLIGVAWALWAPIIVAVTMFMLWADPSDIDARNGEATCAVKPGELNFDRGRYWATFSFKSDGETWMYGNEYGSWQGETGELSGIDIREGSLVIDFRPEILGVGGPSPAAEFSGLPERCTEALRDLIARSPHLRRVANE